MKVNVEWVIAGVLALTGLAAVCVMGDRLDEVECELAEARLDIRHLEAKVDILKNECQGLALYNRLKVGSIPTFSEDENWNKWAERYCEHYDEMRYFERIV